MKRAYTQNRQIGSLTGGRFSGSLCLQYLEQRMSILSPITDWISSQIAGPAPRLCFYQVTSTDEALPGQDQPIRPQRDYLRIILAEMRLKNGTKWFTTRYPAVYALLTLSFGGRDTDIANVVGPTRLPNIDSQHLDRSIVLNSHLTNLLPFSGGTVKLEAGLVSLTANDTVKALLQTIGAFAAQLNVPALSTALNLSGPVVEGVRGLLGASAAELVVRLSDTYSAFTMRPGYTVAFGIGGDAIDPRQLMVNEGMLRYSNRGGPASEQVLDFDYMMFRIERVETRDDFNELVSIRGPFERAVSALADAGEGSIERGRELLRGAIAAALVSPDLTKADQLRVAKALKARFEEISAAFGAVPVGPTDLSEIIRTYGGSDRISETDLHRSPEQVERELFSK
jgi:hypothetical protein